MVTLSTSHLFIAEDHVDPPWTPAASSTSICHSVTYGVGMEALDGGMHACIGAQVEVGFPSECLSASLAGFAMSEAVAGML